MTENNFLSLIIFAPLLGAIINGLLGKRMKSELFSGAVACTTSGISCVIAFMVSFGIGTGQEGALFAEKPVLDQLWTWIQVGNFRADFGLGIDHLSGIYVCFITFDVITDKQIRTKPDTFPTDKHQQKIIRQNERQHREHKQIQISEKAIVTFIAVHISGCKNVNQ